jgi:hypothetical protein
MRVPRMLLAVACGVLMVVASLKAQPSAAQPPPSAATAPPAAQAPPPFKATVDQLAWVRGAWTGTLGERTVEQHWSAPLGGSIIAMYRSIQANRATLYELLAIEQEGEGVVLRIKHFAPGPGLVSREAKDESANNRLVSLDGRTAVFHGGDAANPVRITFNSPDSATLNIVSERQRDGKPVATEFKYKRITP